MQKTQQEMEGIRIKEEELENTFDFLWPFLSIPALFLVLLNQYSVKY